MSQQNYIKAGLDLSPLSSVSQEQLMQAISGSTPLPNIGFTIISTTRPDITNNPIMINFIWLDITDPANVILKRYIANRTVLVDADASWETFGVANLSVLTAMIATRSITGGVDLTRMKLNSDYSASLGSIYYLIRVAANGKDIEAVSLDTALADGGGVALARLALAGAGAQKYLGISAGALAYKYLDPANDISAALANQIPVSTAIAPGTALYLLRTNAAGTAAEWIAPSDASFITTLAQIAAGGAATNDIIKFNGVNWVKVTPGLEIVGGSALNNGVVSTTGAGDLTVNLHSFTGFGVGTAPRLVSVVLKCVTAGDGTYAVDDEVGVDALSDETADGQSAASVIIDKTATGNILVAFEGGATRTLPAKAGGARTTITNARWKPKVYAWL